MVFLSFFAKEFNMAADNNGFFPILTYKNREFVLIEKPENVPMGTSITIIRCNATEMDRLLANQAFMYGYNEGVAQTEQNSND